MNELALFAGAGGGILGSWLLGFRTVCAVEIDAYCREVLLRRQEEKILEAFPIWDDIRTFDGKPWRGAVDIVTAGFPCQPFSAAGRRKGAADNRNLWPETIRIIREVGPRYAFLENVPNLLAYDYFGEVLGSLAEAGFDARWTVVSAAECGAPHVRERIWILAHAKSARRYDSLFWKTNARNDSKDVSNANGIGRKYKGRRLSEVAKSRCGSQGTPDGPTSWWTAEPNMGRVANGVANRMDRLKALGNGQVPRVVEEAWRRLTS